MATYLIVPNDSCELSDGLRKRIDNLFTKEEDKFYFAKNNACFVQYDGITEVLRDKLRLQGTSTEKSISATIFYISPGRFNGYGPSNMWEWLAVKAE